MKTFDELFAELSRKAAERPEGSGTVRELDAGVHTIGKKIVEEAAEVWMAAEYESDEAAAEDDGRDTRSSLQPTTAVLCARGRRGPAALLAGSGTTGPGAPPPRNKYIYTSTIIYLYFQFLLRQTIFGMLPEFSLPSFAAGGGHVREICGVRGANGELHWTLQLVELRGPLGILHLAHEATHVLAGIGGPQVDVGPGASVGLRKERVLRHTDSLLELHRPRLRAAELSRIIVLSTVAARARPALVFADLHGASVLPDGVRAVVVRSGRVSTGGSTAAAMETLVLPSAMTVDSVVARGPGIVADDARVLMVIG